MTVPSLRSFSVRRAPLPFAVTSSKRSMTSPPAKLRAPKRDSAGKTYELSELALKAFCSTWNQRKCSVSGELLV